MIRRIQPGGVARAWREDIPGPVDVLNLIRVSEHFESYRWYGLLVAPLVYGLGGSIRWMGKHERSIAGEEQADKLLIVRYRSHRRFLAMTLNPYYLAINKLRERGVDRFEASWTRASTDDARLGSRRRLLVAHYNSRAGEDALARVRDVLEPAAGEFVYASREAARMDFLSPPRDTDPHPLRYGEVAFFEPTEAALSNGVVGTTELAALEQATDGLSLQLYKREPPQANLPRLPFAGR